MSTARNYIPHYSVKEYRQWEGDWELWNGVPVAMTPSPFGGHARVVARVTASLVQTIDSSLCQATVLPELDWIIADDMVLRPDIAVVCGSAPERHLETRPAIVVEVLSDSTRERDVHYKRLIYEEQQVPYYLMVDPADSSLVLLSLTSDGSYTATRSLASETSSQLSFRICESYQLTIAVADVFR